MQALKKMGKMQNMLQCMHSYASRFDFSPKGAKFRFESRIIGFLLIRNRSQDGFAKIGIGIFDVLSSI